MCLPQFEDRHPSYNAPTSYRTTNEEPSIFVKMLGRRCFRRAAGISGGGEIPLFVLLPRCDEVVAIDHSYQSLSSAYMKIILLDILGPAKMREMLIESRYDDLLSAAKDGHGRLPPELAKQTPLSRQDFKETRREWHFFPLRTIERAYARLERLTLVHGDLMDLSRFGKFDLLYVSNATEHVNRLRRNATLTDFVPIVGKGKLMLSTLSKSYSDAPPKPHKDWELVGDVEGFRTAWQHQLRRRRVPIEEVGQ